MNDFCKGYIAGAASAMALLTKPGTEERAVARGRVTGYLAEDEVNGLELVLAFDRKLASEDKARGNCRDDEPIDQKCPDCRTPFKFGVYQCRC